MQETDCFICKGKQNKLSASVSGRFLLDALSPFVRQVVGLPHKWGIPRAVTIGHTACYANVSVSCKEMDTFSKYQNDSGQAGATAPSSSPVFTHCAGTPRSAAEGVSPVPGQSPYQSHSKPILAPAHTTRPSEQRVTIAWGNALLSHGATRYYCVGQRVTIAWGNALWQSVRRDVSAGRKSR